MKFKEEYLIVNIINWSLIGLFTIFVTTLIVFLVLYLKGKKKRFQSSKTKTKFAILVPARNESKVIDLTLKILFDSNYPKDLFDAYVMVSNDNDPTLEICKKYPNVFTGVRKTTDVGKGYVLDEMIKEIIASKKEYDAYLVLDADNLVDCDFLLNMSNAFQSGYDIVVGRRINKNPNTSMTSGASGITFTVINQMNSLKSRNQQALLLTGTGFCIRASIINNEGGWIFHSLTEDYELSMYAQKNGLTSTYTKDAIFFDEQPIKLSDSIKQRTRWVKGFVGNNKGKRKINVTSFSAFAIAITYIVFLVFNIGLGIFDIFHGKQLTGFYIAISALVFYFVVVSLLSFFLILADKKKSKITIKSAIKSSLFHPIFLATYLVSFFRIFKKGCNWEEIPHSIDKL